jgi:hypothetical protein
MGLFSDDKAILDFYICANCGYVELYISDEAVLDKIAERWPRADG